MKNLKDINAVGKSIIIIISAMAVCIIVFCTVGKACYGPEDLLYNGTDTGEIGVTSFGDARIFSYGPYIDLKSGTYKITIRYEASEDTSFDVAYNKGAEIISSGDMPANKKEITFFIDCPDAENCEVRTYYGGSGYLKIEQVQIREHHAINYYIIAVFIVAVFGFLWVHKGIDKTLLYRPKEIVYYTLFYVTLFLFIFFFVHDKTSPFAVICMLGTILFHAYGAKLKLYEKISYHCLMYGFSYIYFVVLFLLLDMILRFATAESTLISEQTYIQNYYSLRLILIFMLILSAIPNLLMKKLVFYVAYFAFIIVLLAQILYYNVFGRLFSFNELKLAKEGSAYMNYIAGLLNVKLVVMVFLLAIAGVLGINLLKYIRQFHLEIFAVMLASIVLIHLYVSPFYNEEYGDWNSFQNDSYIYQSMSNRLEVFNLCGFYQYELKDIKNTLLKNTGQKKGMAEDIDNFFSIKNSVDSHAENKWTGLFKDKNVLFFLMESIDDIACNPDVMPTLYRMQQEGIYFENMYAPIFGSAATLNSEFATNVGLYAPVSGEPVYSFSDNSYPYSLAYRFWENGYTARQFHYNSPSFYMRDNMNRAFGYQGYICYADYVSEYDIMDDTVLASSDELYSKLIECDRFLDYIITFSAHLDYLDSDPLVVSSLQSHPELRNLTDSDEVNNYFAKAHITDDMLEKIILRLDADGLLDDTIIICIGDHYPYGISDKEVLYRLSDVGRYEQLLYKVPCVIWGKDVNSANIQKVTSTLDLLPTIINLFGLGNTSPYLGHDILDEDYDGMAYFADGSWLTADCYYHQGDFIYGTADEDEIERMNKLVMDFLQTNDKILMSDYYRYDECY